jgi:hypothetical protein
MGRLVREMRLWSITHDRIPPQLGLAVPNVAWRRTEQAFAVIGCAKKKSEMNSFG